MTFGERLKQFRESRGLTQEQLATAIGVAKTTVTGYERGNREPDVAKIKKLAAALGVSGDELLGTGQEKKPTPVSEDGLNNGAKAVLDACSGFTLDEWREMLHFAEYLVSKRTQEKES